MIDTPPPQFGTFFVPGPTEIRPEILERLTRPIMGHRNRAFEAMFARIAAGPILSLVNGGFSERFAVVAETCARTVERVVVPWGSTFDLNVIEKALSRKRFAAVTVAHSETSTGVITDVRAVAE